MAYNNGNNEGWELWDYQLDFYKFLGIKDDELVFKAPKHLEEIRFTAELHHENAEIDCAEKGITDAGKVFMEGYYWIASKFEGDRDEPFQTFEENPYRVQEELYNKINEYIES